MDNISSHFTATPAHRALQASTSRAPTQHEANARLLQAAKENNINEMENAIRNGAKINAKFNIWMSQVEFYVISILGNDNEDENYDVSLDPLNIILSLSYGYHIDSFNLRVRLSHRAFVSSPSAALLFPGTWSSREQLLTAGMRTRKNTIPLQ